MPDKLDFLVIGAQKAGTTALWHHLRGHPDLYLAPDKEAAFFSDSVLYDRGLQWYLNEFFPLAPQDALVGKITPPYMVGEEDAPVEIIVQRIRRDLPGVKLIALLRDPIERATSHFRMSQRRGMEERSFAEAIAYLLQPAAAEVGRKNPTETNSYIAAGEYGRILRLYRSAFPAERFLILFTEDLRRRPRDTLARLLTFLGADREWPGLDDVGNDYFVGGSRRRVSVEAERSLFEHMKREIYPLIGEGRQDLAARSFGFFFTGWNVVPDDEIPLLPDDLRRELEQRFQNDGELLHDLGYEAPWLRCFGRPSKDRVDVTEPDRPEVRTERFTTRIRELEVALDLNRYRLNQIQRSHGIRGAAYSLFGRLVPEGTRRRTWARTWWRAVRSTSSRST